jgi:hypothetical protein
MVADVAGPLHVLKLLIERGHDRGPEDLERGNAGSVGARAVTLGRGGQGLARGGIECGLMRPIEGPIEQSAERPLEGATAEGLLEAGASGAQVRAASTRAAAHRGHDDAVGAPTQAHQRPLRASRTARDAGSYRLAQSAPPRPS